MTEEDFVDVVRAPCAAVGRALALLGDGPWPECVEKHSHKAASRRDAGLSGRIGPAAAARVGAALADTPYAWMLDLSAMSWPPGIKRPEPAAHPDGPRPKGSGFLSGAGRGPRRPLPGPGARRREATV